LLQEGDKQRRGEKDHNDLDSGKPRLFVVECFQLGPKAIHVLTGSGQNDS
jgi:hypothetical protein